jgi:hypothetical protein
MDYSIVITPGARCSNCKNDPQIINTSIGPLVRCPVYGQVNENFQAEHCINYYAKDRPALTPPEEKGER